MKKTLISLAATAGLSLTGIAIIAIYLTGVYLFPGTLNELSLIVGMTVIIGIAWMKFSHHLDELQCEKLHFKVHNVNGLFVIMAIYSMILIFIGRHAEIKPLPVYMWIIIVTTIILFDTILLTKKNLWEGRIFHGITIMFLVSMAMYEHSQYVWLISIAYVAAVIFISAMGVFRWKKMDIYLGGYSLMIALVLTVIHFWLSITSFIYGLTVFELIVGFMALAIIALAFVYRRHVLTQRRNREITRVRQEEEAQLKKAEKKFRADQERQIQDAITGKILNNEISIQEFALCSENTLNSVKSQWMEIVERLNLTEIIEVSEIKGKLVWNQSELCSVLKNYSHMYECSQNDRLLQLIIDKVAAIKPLLDQKKYKGSDTLTYQLNREAHRITSF